MSNRLYISVDAVKRDWLPDLAGVDGYDDRVMDLIRQVSKDIEEMCRSHTKLTPTYFIPVVEVRLFDHPWDTNWLKLDQWLLAVTAFTTKNGATPVTVNNYYLTQWGGYNKSPYNLVLMKSSNTLTYTGTPRQANSVAGQWGYADETETLDATLAEDLDASETDVSVSDGSVIEKGWMLLVDSEQLFVESMSANTVIVKRGEGGTTAATHTSGTVISRYVPPRDITKLAGISVARLYHRGTTAFADTTGAPPGGLPYVAANVPDALAVIDRYRREKWW